MPGWVGSGPGEGMPFFFAFQLPWAACTATTRRFEMKGVMGGGVGRMQLVGLLALCLWYHPAAVCSSMSLATFWVPMDTDSPSALWVRVHGALPMHEHFLDWPRVVL